MILVPPEVLAWNAEEAFTWPSLEGEPWDSALAVASKRALGFPRGGS